MNIIFKSYDNKLSGPVSRLDCSHNIDSIIFKVYDNIYLNDKFFTYIADLLEDLYDNNEFVIFKLYFINVDRNNDLMIKSKKDFYNKIK